MSEIKFNTPLRFENQPSKSCHQTLVEWVDSYFYLGGRTVRVIDSSTNHLKIELANPPSSPSLITTSLKIISYFTLALPLLMLLAQTLLRSSYRFSFSLDSLDISTLGLNLDETCTVSLTNFDKNSHNIVEKHIKEPFTLRKAVRDVIAKIKETAKDGKKNNLLLSTQFPGLKKGSILFFYAHFCGEENNRWLDRILKALEEKGYIQLIKSTSPGPSIDLK